MTLTTPPRRMTTSSNYRFTSHVVNQPMWETASAPGFQISVVCVRPGRWRNGHG
jgi:hypothetical protein